MHEATHRELETVRDMNGQLRQDHDHARQLLQSAFDSIASLTEQMKAQAIMLHREQERRALEAPPVEEPVEAPKPGLLRRWFGQSTRNRQVRIGHA
jgi:hypothetical protein